MNIIVTQSTEMAVFIGGSAFLSLIYWNIAINITTKLKDSPLNPHVINITIVPIHTITHYSYNYHLHV